jgi:hypothetical protein
MTTQAETRVNTGKIPQTERSVPNGAADFYPLLAKVGKGTLAALQRSGLDCCRTYSFDHRVGHFQLRSMTAEPFLISFFASCTIGARFQHFSQAFHK